MKARTWNLLTSKQCFIECSNDDSATISGHFYDNCKEKITTNSNTINGNALHLSKNLPIPGTITLWKKELENSCKKLPTNNPHLSLILLFLLCLQNALAWVDHHHLVDTYSLS